MVEATEGLLREWDQRASGRRLDILPEMMRLSLRIAGLTLFSADISSEADRSAEPFGPPWLMSACG